MASYFVRKGIFAGDPFQIVYRTLETVDEQTGLPLIFTLRTLPGVYWTAEEAQAEADRLNNMVPPPELEQYCN